MFTDKDDLNLAQRHHSGEQAFLKTSLPKPSQGNVSEASDHSQHRKIKFFYYRFKNRLSVILSLADWQVLLDLFAELEKLQLALSGRPMTTMQPIQLANYVSFKGKQLVVLPADAWERLIRQIKECLHSADWEEFNQKVRLLEVENIDEAIDEAIDFVEPSLLQAETQPAVDHFSVEDLTSQAQPRENQPQNAQFR